LRVWQGVEHVFIQDADATDAIAPGDLVPGHAELAHNEDIERNAEPLRYFERNRHPAARRARTMTSSRQRSSTIVPQVVDQRRLGPEKGVMAARRKIISFGRELRRTCDSRRHKTNGSSDRLFRRRIAGFDIGV